MLWSHSVPFSPGQIPQRPHGPARPVRPGGGLPQSQRGGQPLRLDWSSGHVPGSVIDRIEAELLLTPHNVDFKYTSGKSTFVPLASAGFWNFEDVTRPFVSQAVISDGHFFSFFCYQLNTVALSVEADAGNPRNNLLWGTKSLRLYEDVRDGEVVGLNDDVIKLLVQFLLNQPES